MDLDFLQDFILTQIKITVSVICSMAIYLYISFSPTTPLSGQNLEDVESPLIPTFIVFFIAFFFVSIFVGSFDITC